MRNCFSLLFVWLERESHQKPQLTLATLHPSLPPSSCPSPTTPLHCVWCNIKNPRQICSYIFFCTMSSRGLRFYFVLFFRFFIFSLFLPFFIFSSIFLAYFFYGCLSRWHFLHAEFRVFIFFVVDGFC